MAEFIGAPDDVQRHDEQCNYAINMIEDAPAADIVRQCGVKTVNMHTTITKKVVVGLFVMVIFNMLTLNQMIFVAMEK